MSDNVLIKKIREMNSLELLEEILDDPSYITDIYFNDVCKAIYHRFELLKKLHEKEGLSMEEIELTRPQGNPQYELWREWKDLSGKINVLGNILGIGIQNEFPYLKRTQHSPGIFIKQTLIAKEQFQKEFAVTIKQLTQAHNKIVNLLEKTIKNTPKLKKN